MGRRAALLIVAVLIAAAGTALILMYVQGINARAVEGQDRVSVLAATAVIEPGETMADAQAAGKVDAIEIPRETMVNGALSSTEGLAEKVAVSTIYPGEQIMPQKFGDAGSEESLSIPDNKVAISVNLDDPARVAGFVNPGSHVAIFISGEPELYKADGSTQPLPPITKLLLPKVQVVGVGTTTVQETTTTDEAGQETTEQLPRTLLTLAVSQEEAEKVVFGARNGDLAFALLNDKSKVADSSGTTASDIFAEALQ